MADTIPMDVLQGIDNAMLAERAAARRDGPDAWSRQLRTEALETMTQRFGVSEARARQDLDSHLAASPEAEERALEAIVYEMRFLEHAGEHDPLKGTSDGTEGADDE